MTNNNLNSKIWIHLILGTANKLPLILAEIEKQIHTILQECFKNQLTEIKVVDGTPDHIHVLFQLNSEKSISEIVDAIITESTLLINKELFQANSFRWNSNYAAFSVSESQVVKVVDYIKNQKETHKQKSFQKEFDEFLILHGIST